MEYRFLINTPWGLAGTEHDLPREAISECVRQLSLEPWRFCIPAQLGLSYLEKPPVDLVDIEVPAIRSPLDDKEAIQTKLEQAKDEEACARSEREEVKTELLQAEAELFPLLMGTALVGIDEETNVKAVALRERIDFLVETMANSAYEEAFSRTLREQYEIRLADQPTLDHNQVAELRRLALKIAQFPGLADEVLRCPEKLRGGWMFMYGPVAHQIAVEFLSRLTTLGNAEWIRLAADRLLIWATKYNTEIHSLTKVPG